MKGLCVAYIPCSKCEENKCNICELSMYREGTLTKDKWISVDERLPEENGRYLACVDISHFAFENLITVAVMAYGKSHGFYLYNETEKVTHWMPLPEPPKMKGGAE